MNTLYLWLISQTENRGWVTYGSAVVIAEDVRQASWIHPSGKSRWECSGRWTSDWDKNNWASSPESITAKQIGIATEGKSGDVVLANFRAG
mgnify:CR=1 FL=1